jgi:AcrR family transcriptional regulator
MAATRRRGEALEDAILEAGWQHLVSEGYQGFMFEAIAERAKTGKAVLYRRWPDKEALLLAVLAHRGFGIQPAIPDTGSLREDILVLLRSANRLGDSAPALFSTVLGAYFDETETTPAQLRARLLGDRSLAMAQIVQRAVERGELPATPPPRVMALPSDLFRNELLMHLSRVPEETLVDIVDTVFLPLATRPTNTLSRSTGDS